MLENYLKAVREPLQISEFFEKAPCSPSCPPGCQKCVDVPLDSRSVRGKPILEKCRVCVDSYGPTDIPPQQEDEEEQGEGRTVRTDAPGYTTQTGVGWLPPGVWEGNATPSTSVGGFGQQGWNQQPYDPAAPVSFSQLNTCADGPNYWCTSKAKAAECGMSANTGICASFCSNQNMQGSEFCAQTSGTGISPSLNSGITSQSLISVNNITPKNNNNTLLVVTAIIILLLLLAGVGFYLYKKSNNPTPSQ